MKGPLSPNRRQLLALWLSIALSATLLRRAAGSPSDRGIGGTGAAPPSDDNDRGIGGTGVIGTIRKFGSIVVNDLRISYPPDAVVRIDGAPAAVSDLKIGQVVHVAASGQSGSLSTGTIDVTSEVVGPLERVRGKTLTVLGQTVSAGGMKVRGLAVGDTVAVSGLRRNDGTIVASLIERRDGAMPRVAGPVTLRQDGGLTVGGLALKGVDPDLIGRRAVLEGQLAGGGFAVSRGVAVSSLLPDVSRLSIESYVERRGDTLALGSGFDVGGGGNLDLPAGRSVRAVVNTSVGGDGRLVVNSVRADGRTFAPGGGGPGGSRGGGGNGGANGGGGRGGGLGGPGGGRQGGASGGTSVPMDFSHGGAGGAGGNGSAAPRGFDGNTGFGAGGGSPGGLPGGGFGGGGFGGGGLGGGGPGGGGSLGGGGLGGGRR